jgi:hypothetical protein
MKVLIYDKHIPCWFELSWLPTVPFRRKTPTIILRIHNDLQAIFPTGGIVPVVQEGLDFLPEKGALVKSVEGFTNFLVPLPTVKKTTGLLCEECDGTGKRFENGDCFSCDGSGQGVELDFTEINGICRELAHLTTSLRYPPDQDVHTNLPQLLSVKTMFEQGMDGAALCGEYSVPFVNWLSSFGDGRMELTEMVRAMKVAYTHMAGRVYSDFDFQAVIENNKGWLNVSCPGDRCGLHPGSSHGWNRGEGYEFSSHNVDSPIQQLTLLAGLAALSDKVRS